MGRTPATHIDEGLCTGCGLCVEVCPADTLAIVDGKSRVKGDHSIHCAQCAAVCPEGAIRVDDVLDVTLDIENASADLKALFKVMRNRRSCRSYTEEPVDRSVLEALVNIGITTPSGSNRQRWRFTILKDRAAMERFAVEVCDFYKRMNRLARNGLVRLLTKLFAKDVLGRYFRHYYDAVEEAIDEWESNGRDRLFYGATAGIVVSVAQGASRPGDDALLASQNILLAAESMGLGTCLIGFAVEPLQRDRRVARAIGIPDEETVYAVIALGHPAVRYARPAGRKRPVLRFI